MTKNLPAPVTENPLDGNLPPEVEALSPRRQRFVLGRVLEGLNQADAYMAAGYECSHKSAQSGGCTLDHDPAIQAAAYALARGLMRSEAPKSIRVLVAIRDNEKLKASDRLKAADSLLDRCGLGSISKHEHTVTHQLSEAQQDRRILELAKELGLHADEAKKLVMDPSNVIDAEYTPVPLTLEQQAARSRKDARNARERELRSLSPSERAAAKAEVQAKRGAELRAKRQAHEASRQIDLEDYLSDPADDIEGSTEGSTEGIEDLLA